MSLLFVLLDPMDVAHEWMKIGTALAAVIAVFGAAYGISAIARSAIESIARQPEAGNDLRSSMLVAAALIEGITFFALVIVLLTLFV
ncbi:MAG: ATP synthase F0 subunit C [Bacteroidales bacterium]